MCHLIRWEVDYNITFLKNLENDVFYDNQICFSFVFEANISANKS